MNSLQIQYFLAVVEQNGYTEAAKTLYVSQPAVSKQIRLLEEELGYPLFERRGKTMVLTYEGRAFHDYFIQGRLQLERLKARLEEKRESGRIPLRISYLEGMDQGYFFDKMKEAAFKSEVSVKLSAACYPLPQLLKSLYTGQSDAVLTFGSPLTGENLHMDPLFEVPRVLLYSRKRFGEGEKEILDFKKERFFLPEDEYTVNLEQTLSSLFLRYGFTPNIEYTPNFTTIMDRVERGEGVFVYNRWCRQCSQKNFAFLELEEKQTIYLVRRERGTGREVVEFLENFRKAFS